MHVRKVTTLADLERVREIRNDCRQWMTRDRRYIDAEQQRKWWEAVPRDLWLFDGAAYALITERDRRRWISLGVAREHRGKGLGTAIYAHFPGVWAEIRRDNAASLRAAEKAGYVVEREQGRVVVMHGGK